jgi:Flp pilus assembly protein TadD
VECCFDLAVAYTRIKDYEGAAEYFRAALKLREDDPDLHTRLGIAMMFLGNREEAKKHFQTVFACSPVITKPVSTCTDWKRPTGLLSHKYMVAVSSFY